MTTKPSKRAYVETYGCQMNISDGELMEGILERSGYDIVGRPEDADVVLDARFLPNPYWEAELRERTGLEAPVNDYVVARPEAREFLDGVAGLLDLVSAA